MASTGPVNAPTVAHAGSQVGGRRRAPALRLEQLIAGGWARLNKLLNKRVRATSAVHATRIDLNSALPDAEQGNFPHALFLARRLRRSFLARSLVDIHWCLTIIFAPRRTQTYIAYSL